MSAAIQNLRDRLPLSGRLRQRARQRLERGLTMLGLSAVALALLGTAQAGSACTSVYGTRMTGGVSSVVFYDTYANTYQTLAPISGNAPNAAALDPATGRVYFIDQDTDRLNYYDPLTMGISGTLGTVTVPSPNNTSPALGSSDTNPIIIGATFAANGNLYALYTSYYQTGGGKTVVGQINPSNGSLIGRYNELRAGTSAVVSPFTNGDIVSNGSSNYVVAEPGGVPTLYTLDVSTGALSSPVRLKLNGNAFTTGTATVNGLAYNPVTRQFYVNLKGESDQALDGLYTLDAATGTLTDPDGGASYAGITDLASCGVLPDVPSLIKAFSPATAVGAPATTRLTLTLGNTNTGPYYLTAPLTDRFPTSPAQIVVANPLALSGSCLVTTGVTRGNAALVTPAAGDAQLTLKAGLTVPVGGCTLSVAVSVPAAGLYTNTIAAAALKTTAGNTASAASATFTVSAPTALSIIKSHSPATLAAGEQGTYTLNVSNAAAPAGAARNPTGGTITVVDTLPASVGIAPASGFQVSSGGLTWTCSYADELVSSYLNSGQTLTCTTSGSLAAGASSAISFLVTVLPDAGGSAVNTAAVGGGGDPFNGGAVPTGPACDAAHCAADTAPVTALPVPPATCTSGTTTNLLATPNSGGYSDRDTGSDSYPVALIANPAAYRLGVGALGAYIVDIDWWFNNGNPNPSHASTLSLYVNGTEYARVTSNEGLGGAAGLVGLNGATVSAGWLDRGHYKGAYPKLRSYVTLPTGVTQISSAELRFTGGPSGTADDYGFNLRALNACVKLAAKLAATKTVQNLTAGTAAGSTGSGKPGDVLEYCIATQNVGSLNTTKLAFSDNVPSNTNAQAGAYGAGQDIRIVLPGGTSYATFAADSDAGQLGGGAISVSLPTLILQPGQSFTVCFRSTIG